MAPAFNPSTSEAEANLVYGENSKVAKATQILSPVLEKEKKANQMCSYCFGMQMFYGT